MNIKLTSEIVVELVQQMGGDEMIARAAMVSTKGQLANESVPLEKQNGLIRYLMKHRHGTPFEHAGVTFFVRAPIFVWREWHRHRVGFSYNEESARYKQLEPEFYVPAPERPLIPEGTSARPKYGPATAEQHATLVSTLKDSYMASYTAYDGMIRAGFAKEVARAVLPVGVFSSCWVTCNPRSLMHFLSLRVHDENAQFISYPQYEIQLAATAAEEILKAGWPITHAAFCENRRVAP